MSRKLRRSILGALIFLAATAAVPDTTSGQEIFGDGFESGDTTRWSIRIPIPDPVDGTYQLAVYDSFAFASGGNLVIANRKVNAVNGTYFNFEKVDGGGVPQCTVFFLWGGGLDPTNVEDFEFGVEFSDTYHNYGEMTWTLTFSLDDDIGFPGTLAAVGAGFTGVDSGCNGTFPTFTIKGGKRNWSTQ
ncbi:MAG: hypothetical protein IFK92_15400 [Acidobacteria bacterium]|nr:hypothetical protein [Candidatus Sulfomarinibacter kjeldsenii]